MKEIKLTFVGRAHMSNIPIYEDQNNKRWANVNHLDEEHPDFRLYEDFMDDFDTFEQDIKNKPSIHDIYENSNVIIESNYEKDPVLKANYMLLGRLQSDCEFFLDREFGHQNRLWAKDVESQIEKMKELWHSFPEDKKPKWISLDKIEYYNLAMQKLLEEKEGIQFTSVSSKTRYFIDMDGVLAKFNNKLPSLDVLYEEGYFKNLEPQSNVVKTINTLFSKHPSDVFILSSVLDTPYAKSEKLEWLSQHIPNIPKEQVLFCEYGKDKSLVVPGGVNKTDYLLDDYTKNLTAWIDDGGNAIKLVNDINDTNQSFEGYRVYYNDSSLLESIEHTVDNIQKGNPPAMFEKYGTFIVDIDYVSHNVYPIQEQVQELVQRLSNIRNSSAIPDLKLSMKIDGIEILKNEKIQGIELVNKPLDESLKSLITFAKTKVIADLANITANNPDSTIDKYNAIRSVEETLDYQVLEETVTMKI